MVRKRGHDNKKHVRGPFCSVPDKVVFQKAEGHKAYQEEVREYNADLREFVAYNQDRKRQEEALSDEEEDEALRNPTGKRRRKIATEKATAEEAAKKAARSAKAAAAVAAAAASVNNEEVSDFSDSDDEDAEKGGNRKNGGGGRTAKKKAKVVIEYNDDVSDDEDIGAKTMKKKDVSDAAESSLAGSANADQMAATGTTTTIKSAFVSTMGKKPQQKIQRLKQSGDYFSKDPEVTGKTVEQLVKMSKIVQMAVADVMDEVCLRKRFRDMGTTHKYFQAGKYKIRYCLSIDDIPVTQIIRDLTKK